MITVTLCGERGGPAITIHAETVDEVVRIIKEHHTPKEGAGQ